MNPKKKRVGVAPLGEVPEAAIKVIRTNIFTTFGLEAEILPPLEFPIYALDKLRLQFNAGTILKALEKMPDHGYEKVIGVLDVDLFIPIFTHVFGEAKMGGKYALVSLHRLKKNTDGSPLPEARWLDRAAKVALHELGHLFKMLHCPDEKCLMYFSGKLHDLDGISLFFCQYCEAFLKKIISA